jgi:hypothetical protein
VILFGVGSETCAQCLSSPANVVNGYNWIMILFTGRAVEASNQGFRAQVGHGTDGQGVVRDVERVCQQDPSKLLIVAANEVYLLRKQQGR